MVATRRRGEELECAILDAVRAEVAEHGYAGTTYEGVAVRAKTSKPVLYRRWPTKAEMVLTASIAVITNDDPPDTGSLQQDLKDVLRLMRTVVERTGRRTVVSLMAELSQQDAQSLRILLFSLGTDVIRPILERARERGELGETELPARLVALPLDLVRHELIIIGTVTDEMIDSIVDDVTLPLLRLQSFKPPP